jgi:hypothetical protein
VCLVLCLLVVSLGAAGAEQSNPEWLAWVNYYRATAGLPPIHENPALSGRVWKHARYMVMNDRVRHAEEKGSWYSAEGAHAATVSNLAGALSHDASERWAIEQWMQAPFHALGILDPGLRSTGFGIYRETNGGVQTAAGIDIVSGRNHDGSNVRYPIVWPGNGATVPLGRHSGEYPDPLGSCPKYRAPVGLPILVQLGSGSGRPVVTATKISEGGQPIEHCVFDETTFRHRDAEQQRIGRRILDARDAVVLIPRAPLRSGSRYTVDVAADERIIRWSFSVR